MRFYALGAALIASLVTVGLCIRALALREMPVSETLVVRGLSCLALVLIYARSRKLSLIPTSIRTQTFRAALAGLALTFLSLSYNWLSASAVSVLSNIDVPLLVVLGPLIGVSASIRSRALSAISILLLIVYVANLEAQVELIYGLSSLLVGTILLCFGYFFIKKSMNDENEAIAILTPSLAIIAYGAVEMMGQSSLQWTKTDLAICVLSGVAMFFAYIVTMKLYEIRDLASAEFPTLLSSIAIQPIESLMFNETLKPIYLISSIGFVVLTYFIMQFPKNPEEAHAI